MDKKEEKKIDWSLLTPEAAYKRIIEFAEKMMLNYSKPNYSQGAFFRFSWDKNSTYTYEGVDTLKRHIFTRDSDGEYARLDRYAFLPQDQPEEL